MSGAGIIEELKSTLELEGYAQGTTQFARLLCERKIDRCRELKRFQSCGSCPANDICTLLREYSTFFVK